MDSLQHTLEEAHLSVVHQSMTIPKGHIDGLVLPSMPDIKPSAKAELLRMMMADPNTWFDGETFKRTLMDLEGKADLVICTFNLPFLLEDNDLPVKSIAPPLVLLQANVQDIDWMFENTALDTVITHKNIPDVWKPGAKIPKDKQVAFEKRYGLLSAKSP